MLFRTAMLVSLSPIMYRFGGNLFSLRMLKAKSKIQTGVFL